MIDTIFWFLVGMFIWSAIFAFIGRMRRNAKQLAMEKQIKLAAERDLAEYEITDITWVDDDHVVVDLNMKEET